jgi:uncharacterized protein (DUF1697 family)
VQTYVALLRGINLGARNKVSMADLRALVVALGGEDVATYVQSGNVIFKSPVRSPATLTRAIEERIDRDLGLRVPVLLRKPAQLAEVLTGNPFATGKAEPASLHVTFLAETPRRTRVRELEARDFDPDELRVVGREVYLHCPTGYGRTKLGNAYLEKQLDVAATTRNWKTVTKLAELATA